MGKISGIIYSGDTKRSVLCVFRVYWCSGVRASRVDEENQERKKKKMRFFESEYLALRVCILANNDVF